MGDLSGKLSSLSQRRKKGVPERRLIVADARLKEAWALGRMVRVTRPGGASRRPKSPLPRGESSGAGFALRARGTVLYDKAIRRRTKAA